MRGTFDDSSLGSQIAGREGDGAGQASGFGRGGGHNHGLGINSILGMQPSPQAVATFALLPLLQKITQRLVVNGQGIELEQAEVCADAASPPAPRLLERPAPWDDRPGHWARHPLNGGLAC